MEKRDQAFCVGWATEEGEQTKLWRRGREGYRASKNGGGRETRLTSCL